VRPVADAILADTRRPLRDPEAEVGDATQGVVQVPERRLERRVAASGASVGRNLASFGVALLFVVLVLLAACGVGLLIAETFYGYGGLG
jgi:hypothetical protein